LASPPEGCEWAHATCAASETHEENRLPTSADAGNLRCFEQKRRFGIDFLYPTRRYVNALSELSLCPSSPSLDVEDCPGPVVPNPLYAGGRTPDQVYLAGIIGVPWQSIVSEQDAGGGPLASDVLRFKTATELTSTDWDRILGDPSASPPRPPSEPLMVESPLPRPGVVTGGPNGREYDSAQGSPEGDTPDDLQYSCIFPLPGPRDCEGRSAGECDCVLSQSNQPLCEETPGQSAYSTTQHWAKAYPGLRQLDVLRGYGDNSIVASICARNVSDPERPDFGYRPAIASIVDRLSEQLTRRCLPRALEVDADGSVPCTLVEALPASSGCECDPNLARRTPAAPVENAARRQLAGLPGGPCGDDDPGCTRACEERISYILLVCLMGCRDQKEVLSVDVESGS
jgi:hypothetical protein